MLLERFAHDDWDLLVWVSTATDRVAHMFYRLTDPGHPRYDAALAKQYGDAIEKEYERMDATVAAVLEQDAARRHAADPLRPRISRLPPRPARQPMAARGKGLLALKDGAESSEPRLLSGRRLEQDQGVCARHRPDLLEPQGPRAARASSPTPRPPRCCARSTTACSRCATSSATTRTGDRRGVPRARTCSRAAAPPIVPTCRSHSPRTTARAGRSILGGVPRDLFADNPKKWSGDHAASDVKHTDGILISTRPIARDGRRRSSTSRRRRSRSSASRCRATTRASRCSRSARDDRRRARHRSWCAPGSAFVAFLLFKLLASPGRRGAGARAVRERIADAKRRGSDHAASPAQRAAALREAAVLALEELRAAESGCELRASRGAPRPAERGLGWLARDGAAARGALRRARALALAAARGGRAAEQRVPARAGELIPLYAGPLKRPEVARALRRIARRASRVAARNTKGRTACRPASRVWSRFRLSPRRSRRRRSRRRHLAAAAGAAGRAARAAAHAAAAAGRAAGAAVGLIPPLPPVAAVGLTAAAAAFAALPSGPASVAGLGSSSPQPTRATSRASSKPSGCTKRCDIFEASTFIDSSYTAPPPDGAH